MASHIQHDEFRNCVCLPCTGDRRPEDGNHPHQLRSAINEKNSEVKQTEDLLASELNKLSVEERAEAFDDIHCVGEELKETPDIIQKSLAEFEAIAQKKGTPTYEMACNQNRAYIEDPSFRLKFLRANMYDVDKSVRQMMRFLHHKAKYFGDDTVARDISLDDLNEEDMEVLRSGVWHIQKGEDRTGRVIIHILCDMVCRWKVENTIRASYIFFFNILTQHPAVQRKGVVNICHNVSTTVNRFRMPGIDDLHKMTNVAMSIPIRYSAMHYCLFSGKAELNFDILLQIVWHMVPKYSRVRSRIHVGSSMELQYQLRSHGIPSDTFPIDMYGDIRQNIVNGWFDKYRQEESDGSILLQDDNRISSMSSSRQQRTAMVIPENSNQTGSTGQCSLPMHAAAHVSSVNTQSFAPSENDVLLGRGRFAQSWVGNVKFREFLEKHSWEYDRLSRIERQKRTSELTQDLIAKGVRFFKQQEASSEWIEVDFAEARQRVSQMFRTLRKKNYREYYR